MTWPQILLVAGIVLFAVCYYWLAFLALRDLKRRPAVRGNSKVIWGLIILCVPIAGAVIYGYTGAASFLPRQSDRSTTPTSSTLTTRRPFDSWDEPR